MADNEFTSISIKPNTKERLEKAKITPGEYWDDLINRVLNKIGAA